MNGPVQYNLVNCKTERLEILIRSIASSNYKDVVIRINNPAKDYYHFFSIKHMFFERKKKRLRETFLYTFKTYVDIDSKISHKFINRPYSLNELCPKFISFKQVIRKKRELEFSMFYLLYLLMVPVGTPL